ncbi:SIS domain-containing protein [Deinococcus fonticola]|uniref:SIS domain-containing protein n=1 Tax=Deinococcus fonticola TaxID=2528713 RepID=UPI0010754DB0|nr:SIS domain-containing protein [Deinococcus fonticola]
MTSTADFLTLLERLPGSYSGPTRPEPGPHAVVGTGEGTLAAALLRTLIGSNFTREGTQFVLSSPDAADPARTYAELAEVAGANARRISTGGQAGDVDVLVPGGALATYHYAQAVAHASGHADEAQAADRAMTTLAGQCAPHVQDNNPARDLAWSLWGRAPLLIAAPDADALPHAWQHLLARTGKTLSVPLPGDPLAIVTGAFEAQHEHGDGRVALILGDTDPALHIAREILESRIDEIIHVPYPEGTEAGYAGQLAHWYFAAWVAAYLAERYHQTPGDPPMLARAQAVLAGDDADDLSLRADHEDGRRSQVEDNDWEADDEAEERD